MKMCFTYAAIGTHSAGMAGMAPALVDDFQRLRRESGSQFPLDGIGDAHSSPFFGTLRSRRRKVKNFIFLFFNGRTP